MFYRVKDTGRSRLGQTFGKRPASEPKRRVKGCRCGAREYSHSYYHFQATLSSLFLKKFFTGQDRRGLRQSIIFQVK
jgi:hypothetical protein